MCYHNYANEGDIMFNIIFYTDKNEKSKLLEDIETIKNKSKTNKDARIQFRQIILCIELLKINGTMINSNITKHLEDDIWELRPGNNRILYFYFEDNQFILLHMFRKKTNKTPKNEIEKAKRECFDYKLRNGDEHENLGRLQKRY